MFNIAPFVGFLSFPFSEILFCDCFFFNQLFSTLENNISCIFLFLKIFDKFIIFNYTNIYNDNEIILNQNLLNGLTNIHPIFYLLLINFIFQKYFDICFSNIKYLYTYIFYKYDFYLYLSSFMFMLLGIYWASQELLWGLWWSWDFVEIFLLIIIILLIIKDHLLKINPIEDFFFNKNLFFLILLFFFFNKLNLVNSLHTFGSINSDNYFIYILWLLIFILFLININIIYLLFLISLLFKYTYTYIYIYLIIFNFFELFFINFLLIQPFVFIFLQFFFNYNLKHILILSSIFYLLGSTPVFNYNIIYINYFNINQNFILINNIIFYNFFFKIFFYLKINILYFLNKIFFLNCLSNFNKLEFFYSFIFLFFYFKKYKINLFY